MSKHKKNEILSKVSNLFKRLIFLLTKQKIWLSDGSLGSLHLRRSQRIAK